MIHSTVKTETKGQHLKTETKLLKLLSQHI